MMPLAAGDYLFTDDTACPVTFAFAYDACLDPDALRHSLRELTRHIPWLAGRLRAQPGAAYAFDLADAVPPELEVVRSPHAWHELIAGEPLVRLVKAAEGEPLVSLRLTQTPRGSILGISMSHALVDGFSLFYTMTNWAACARGETLSAPQLERRFGFIDDRAAVELAPTPEQLLEQCGLFWREPRGACERLPAQTRVALRGGHLDVLMDEAQRGVSERLSKNDVLTAWLWRTYGRQWWSARPDEHVYITCPVDIRRKLDQPDKPLFACAICFATARATYNELLHAPLGELALRIQRSVADVFAGDVRARYAPLDALRRHHGLRGMNSVHLRHPRRGMLVTNMSRLPLHLLDFGSGAPADLKIYTEIDAMAAVLPAADGVRVEVARPQAERRALAPAPRISARASQTAAR
jgi:shikimate O-hydroxycinnamoyltransferase